MANVKDTYRTVTPYLVVPNADSELDVSESRIRRRLKTCVIGTLTTR